VLSAPVPFVALNVVLGNSMAMQASAQLVHPPGLKWLFAGWKSGKFPKSVCTSVNECVCHGIPDSRPLEDGDIVNIDVTVYLDVRLS